MSEKKTLDLTDEQAKLANEFLLKDGSSTDAIVPEKFIDEATEMPEGSEEKPITLLDMLQYELQECMKIALGYKKNIDEAKTQIKKDYFKKKLKKNNTHAVKILTAIENVTVEKAQVFENEQKPTKE